MTTVLAADIGGTNARLALFDAAGDGRRPLIVRKYESQRHAALADVVRAFLADGDVARAAAGARADAKADAGAGGDAGAAGASTPTATPVAAAYAVAGPVTQGRSYLPNLGWQVDTQALAEVSGIEATILLNDFVAIAESVGALDPIEDLATLQEGVAEERAPIGVIGAGTGLGHAVLAWDDSCGVYRAHPSEAGHVDFAPRTPLERDLLAWLEDQHGRVSWERVVSGPGIVAIYRFLVARGVAGAPDPALAAQVEETQSGALISQAALAGSCPVARQTLAVFVSSYGAQAGNLALYARATGGVYLAGGIAPDILPLLREPEHGFLAAFRAKGRLGPLVGQVPVRVIVHPSPGLVGAAQAARRAAARRGRKAHTPDANPGS